MLANLTRWPTRPPRVEPSDAAGVICYAPSLDAVLCVPCQRVAGPAGHRELGAVRPATSTDLARLSCCSSCGSALVTP